MKLLSWVFGLSIGEAILLSEHLMAAKMHKGACLCCVSKTSYGYTLVYLFVVREDAIQYMDYYAVDAWKYHIGDYGITYHGWTPAEQILPISVIQKVFRKSKQVN